MKTINFGIIGTGLMAATMMEAFKHVANVNVMAVASESTERATSFAARFNIANAYGSVEALLNDPAVEAVYIVNLTESHAATTIKALQAGKAVLCEKPIATSEADCQRIQEIAAKTGKLCMEAMWTHFLPAYQALFNLNATQALGKPTQLYADFGYPTNQVAYPRLFKPSAGSGVLLDRGVYPIALAIKLFGNVMQIKSQVTCNHDGVDTEAIELKWTKESYKQFNVTK
jgi:predicted dehydrogenase